MMERQEDITKELFGSLVQPSGDVPGFYWPSKITAPSPDKIRIEVRSRNEDPTKGQVFRVMKVTPESAFKVGDRVRYNDNLFAGVGVVRAIRHGRLLLYTIADPSQAGRDRGFPGQWHDGDDKDEYTHLFPHTCRHMREKHLSQT